MIQDCSLHFYLPYIVNHTATCNLLDKVVLSSKGTHLVEGREPRFERG